MFVQAELPVAHLGETGLYVPPPARDPGEIQRRHGQYAGHLIAEQQEFGVAVASETLKRLERPEDIRFSADILAVSGLNTAWHLFAEGADMQVMRRNLRVPLLFGPTPDTRPTSDEILRNATRGFDDAKYDAHRVDVATKYGSPRAADFKVQLGRRLGDASLTLAVVDLGDKLAGSPRIRDSYVQKIARARGTRTMSRARTMVNEVGSHPTLAALAEPLSDLRVHIARNAPTGALTAFNEAIEVAEAA